MIKNRREIAQAWYSSTTASFGYIGEKFGLGRHTVRYIVTSVYRGERYEQELKKRGLYKFTTPQEMVTVTCFMCGKSKEINVNEVRERNFCDRECMNAYNAEYFENWSRKEKER